MASFIIGRGSKGGAQRTRTPRVQILSIFMQFLGKFGKIVSKMVDGSCSNQHGLRWMQSAVFLGVWRYSLWDSLMLFL